MTARVFLIVLGDPTHRASFNACFSPTAHRLIFASDGQDGLDRFGEVKPDVVLIDDETAVLDANVVCQQIRKHPVGEDVPILLYGGGSERTVAATANGWFHVPLDAGELLRTLAPYTDEPAPDATAPQPALPSSDLDALSDPEFEITLDSDDGDVQLDPLLEAAARAELEADDSEDIPTNPVELAVGVLDQHDEPSREDLPVFVAPEGLGKTPSHAKRPPGFEVENPPDHSALLEEPMLPSRAPATGPISDTGQQRIEEIPKDATGGLPSQASASGPQPLPDGQADNRRGLAETQLGKRLVRRVNQTFKALDDLDYYQLMSLELNATDQQIRQAYFDLSLEFHPDRFFLLTSGNLKEKIYAIYRRITEAYSVLSDERRRPSYDAGLAEARVKRAPPEARVRRRSEPTIGVSVPGLNVQAQTDEGMKFVRLAQSAFSQRDLHRARLFLSMALVYEPGSQPIQGALGEIVRTRRQTTAAY